MVKYLIWIIGILVYVPWAWGNESIFFPAKSLRAEELLKKAAAMTAKQRWLEAVSYYQEILEKYPRALCQVSPTIFKGARVMVWERLQSLPDAAQQIYRKLVDAKARLLWEDHTLHRAKLRQLVNAYLFSSYGPQALNTLGTFYQIREQYQQATFYFRLYLRYACDDLTTRQAVTAKLGLCYYALGQQAALHTLRQWAQDEFGSAQIRLGMRHLSVGQYLQELAEKVAQRIAHLELHSCWPTLGGDASRCATVPTYYPLPVKNGQLQSKWFQPIAKLTSPMPLRRLLNERPRYVQGPPPFYPIFANGTVFVSNGMEVFAYSLFSRRLKWHYPGLISLPRSVQHEQLVHSLTYHQGAIYVNLEGPTPGQQAEQWHLYQIRVIIPQRKLVKLDAATGRLLWQTGNPQLGEDAFINKASFMTPPLVWGHTLYTGATELAGIYNCYLTAIDPRNGKLRWKRLICSSHQEHNMFGRTVREALGSVVASQDGILYYLTHMGAIAALDAYEGEILWLYHYRRLPIPKPRIANFQTQYRPQTWYNSPLILKNGRVYAAPLDTNELYVLDAHSGKVLWRKPRQRGHHYAYRYLLGVADEKVLLGGHQGIEWRDARNGERRGYCGLQRGERIAGYAACAGNYWLVPTTRYLYRFNREDLTLEQKVPWRDRRRLPGHLICAGQVFLTGSHAGINVLYDESEMQKILQEQIKRHPKEILPYLKLAEIYLQCGPGMLLKAAQCYQQALKLARQAGPRSRARYQYQARSGLVQVYQRLGAIAQTQGEIAKALQYYHQALKHACRPQMQIAVRLALYQLYRSLPPDRQKPARTILESLLQKHAGVKYQLRKKTVTIGFYALWQLATIACEQGHIEEAVGYYQRIIEQFPEENYFAVPARIFAQRQIKELITRYGRKIYQRFDQIAHTLYQQALAHQGVAKLEQVLALYPNCRWVAEVSLAIAMIYLQKHNYTAAAESLRSFLRNFPQHSHKAKVLYHLWQCYHGQQRYKAAKLVLKQLALQYPKAKLVIQGQTITLGTWAQRKLQEPQYQAISEKDMRFLELWQGQEPKWHFRHPALTAQRLLEIQGAIPNIYRHFFFVGRGRGLFCHDTRTGKLIWQIQLQQLIRGVGFIEDAIYCWGDSCLYRLSAQGRQQWSQKIYYGPIRGVSLSLQGLLVTTSKRDHSTISFIDCQGKLRWHQSFSGRYASSPLLGKDCVVVYTREPANVHVYSLAKGRYLKSFLNIEGGRNLRYMRNPPLVTSHTLYLVRDSRRLEAYHLPNLELQWEYNAYSIYGFSLCGNDHFVTFTKISNEVVCLDAYKGTLQWSWACPPRASLRRRLADWEQFFFLQLHGNQWELVAKDARTGKTRWQTILAQRTTTNIQPMIITPRYVVCLKNNYRSRVGWRSQYMIFDKENGKLLKNYRIEGGRRHTIGALTIAGGMLIVSKGNMFWGFGK